MNVSRTPVVFIHGLWLHSTSWSPWLQVFRAAGYAPVAPGYPGEPATVEEARQEPDQLADVSVDDLIAHYAKVIAALDISPIIIGHGLGGLVAQRLLTEGAGVAATVIGPMRITGVRPAPLVRIRASFRVLRSPTDTCQSVALTRKEFRFNFGNALSEQESDSLFERWAVPAPARLLNRMATANLVRRARAGSETRNGARGPLLLVSGLKDRAAPDAGTRSMFEQRRRSTVPTEFKLFPGRGHSMVVDRGWPDVADEVLYWLATKRF